MHQPWPFLLASLHSQVKNLITEATERSYRVDLSTMRPLYKKRMQDLFAEHMNSFIVFAPDALPLRGYN